MIPSFLNKNDAVAVVATAKTFDAATVRRGVAVLRAWGLRVKEGKNLYRQDNFFAGTDAERLSDLQTALDDPEVRAIICARGGYGTSRIIDSLNFTRYARNPSWIVGFSDITMLHLELQRKGIASLHAPMCINLGDAQYASSAQNLKEALAGKFSDIVVAPRAFNRVGKSMGKLIGGNLTMLIHSLATTNDSDWSKRILLIEEVGENLYHLDRMMLQLKRVGKLKSLAGLIVGYCTDMKDSSPSFGKTTNEIIASHCSEYKFPIAFGIPSGHQAPNISLMMGGNYTLDVQKSEVRLSYVSV